MAAAIALPSLERRLANSSMESASSNVMPGSIGARREPMTV